MGGEGGSHIRYKYVFGCVRSGFYYKYVSTGSCIPMNIAVALQNPFGSMTLPNVFKVTV